MGTSDSKSGLEDISNQGVAGASEKWQQDVFDHIPDLIAILDKEHRIIRANLAMRMKLERDGSSIIGRHCYLCVHKLDAPPECCPHAKLLKDGKFHSEEVYLPGVCGDYSITVSPMHDAEGNLIGSIHVARDVSLRKQSEDALRLSEELLREAQQVADLGTYVFDIVANSWSSSDILDNIFGISEEFERTIAGWQSLIHPDDKEMMTKHLLDEVIRNHQRFDKEYRIIRPNDGEEVWVHGKGRLEFNEQKQAVKMIGTIMNITPQKTAEKTLQASEEKFRLLFERSNDAIFITVPEGEVLSANPEACNMFGMTAEELCMNARTAIFDPADNRFAAAFETRRKTGEFKGELNFVRKNGEVFPADVSSSIFTDSMGNIRSTVRVRDITERKRTEEELKKKTAEIEQFIYTVSHDLRSPLVTVKTFLGLLEKDMGSSDQEQITQDLNFIHSAADKMKLLLDELLEMSRLDRVETPSMSISYREVVTEALAALAGVISERDIDIQIPDLDLMLFGARPRLCRIWQNLIENAIKYSRKDSVSHIELGIQQASGETVFFVKDNGIGIEPQYVAKIFNMFEKLDVESPGAGLGLSLVQQIVEKYGGRIWAESGGAMQGSCFLFTLPEAIPDIMNQVQLKNI